MAQIPDNMINLGSKENPILVPEKALETNTQESQEWWQMLANGSVTLEQEALDKLLELIKNAE